MPTTRQATKGESIESDSAVALCDLGSIPAREREAHISLAQSLLFIEGQSIAKLLDGVAFVIPSVRFGDLVRFVENERRCCAHLRFSIEIPPAGAPIELRITGPGACETLAAIVTAPQTLTRISDSK